MFKSEWKEEAKLWTKLIIRLSQTIMRMWRRHQPSLEVAATATLKLAELNCTAASLGGSALAVMAADTQGQIKSFWSRRGSVSAWHGPGCSLTDAGNTVTAGELKLRLREICCSGVSCSLFLISHTKNCQWSRRSSKVNCYIIASLIQLWHN